MAVLSRRAPSAGLAKSPPKAMLMTPSALAAPVRKAVEVGQGALLDRGAQAAAAAGSRWCPSGQAR